MRVHIIISGLLRTFYDTLFPFLNELYSKNIDLYLYICTSGSSDDTKFMNSTTDKQLYKLLLNKHTNICIIDTIDSIENKQAFN
jgi:hypothetical protein